MSGAEEINFDGLVGPTHNYAGLSEGNLASARNAGAWNGNGITSSRAPSQPHYGIAAIRNSDNATTPLFTHFGGQPIDANALLLRYTLDGDSDLNLLLDADDFFRADRGFLTRQAGSRHGDVNLSGKVDLDDYALLDAAFLAQSAPPPAPPAPPAPSSSPASAITSLAHGPVADQLDPGTGAP